MLLILVSYNLLRFYQVLLLFCLNATFIVELEEKGIQINGTKTDYMSMVRAKDMFLLHSFVVSIRLLSVNNFKYLMISFSEK